MENKTILVVDDSMTDFLYVSNILVKNGFKVVHAESGKDAIQESKKIHPDVILMDVVMPEMNGFHATRKIKQEPSTAEIPVVMLTTKAQKTDVLWAQRQGASAYLLKPVDQNKLLKTLEKVLPNQ